MILVVNLCHEPLHQLEFVEPICRVLQKIGQEFILRDAFRIRPGDLEVEKIILCGTSLHDFAYLKFAGGFSWLFDFPGDVLGICAGAQLLSELFGGKLFRSVEIGKTSVVLKKKFFDLSEEFFVYSLHTLGVTCPPGFEEIAFSQQCLQIFKREDGVDERKRLLLGVLFHPEVLQQSIIEEFAKL